MTQGKSYRCEPPSAWKLAITESNHMISPDGTHGGGAVESAGGLHPKGTGGIHCGGRSDEAEGGEGQWDEGGEGDEVDTATGNELVSGSGDLGKSRSLSGSRLTARGHIRLFTASLTQRRLWTLVFLPPTSLSVQSC